MIMKNDVPTPNDRKEPEKVHCMEQWNCPIYSQDGDEPCGVENCRCDTRRSSGQQEYRITEEELKFLEQSPFKLDEIENKKRSSMIRAHPIPASDASNPEEILPPLVCGCQGYTSCNECHEHARERVAAIAAAAVAEDRKRLRPPCEECHWQERLETAVAEERGKSGGCPYWNKAGGDFCKTALTITKAHDARVRAEEREQILSRLDEEIAIRESEMSRKGNLEDNLTTATGYHTASGALNWVRKVLIDGLRGERK